MTEVLHPMLARCWGATVDSLLGIETGDEVPAASGVSVVPANRPSAVSPVRYGDGLRYQAADYLNLWRVQRRLRPLAEEVFFDVGCGKGRVVCVFARFSLRRIVGIELAPTLCEAARRNAERLRGRKSPVEIWCGDAAKACYDEGTIYFLYNPFGEDTLREVLTKIEFTLEHRPRHVRMVYYNSVHAALFQSCRWLRCFDSLQTLTGRPVTFWQNINRR